MPHPHSRVPSLAPALAALVLIPFPALSAQQSEDGSNTDRAATRVVEAIRLGAGESIRLDGRVNEPFWRRGQPAAGFLQEEPDEGAPPTEATEVYVAYDQANLYLGAMLYDSRVDGILAYQKERDAGLMTDDRFMWILDTFLDGRTGYFFEINPAGLMGDGLLGGGRFGVNKSWDGIWEARVARGPDGWSAEIRIPFRTLNFSPSQDTWGINFQRTVRRKNEESRWSGHRRNQQLTRPVHAGHLTGLEGLSQGLGLEVTPYAVSGWRNIPDAEDPTAFPTDAGIDLSYNVTPSLRAAVTVNTDFAEVEVDQRRVNLTRFPLFFPERRDFFLEGSGVFSFAQRNGVDPYFSRQIGLAEGEPVPITYGARMGGQAGRYELGFLQIRTGTDQRLTDEGLEEQLPNEHFTVARVKRTLFSQSSIGAIYTRRATSAVNDSAAPPDRHTLGADLDLYTSRFLGNKNLQFEAFIVWHTDPVAGGTSSLGDVTARGIRLNYPNDALRAHVSFRELGDDFAPAVGFTRRNGFRRVQPTITLAPRPAGIPWIRQLEFEVQYEHLMDLSSGRLETRKTDIVPLQIDFESGDNLSIRITQLFERLDEDFDIRSDVVIPMGDYNTVEWAVTARTAGRRVVSGNVEFSHGEFWSGHRTGFEGGVTVRPAAGVSLRGEFERNDVRLPQGEFVTNLFRLTGGWHFTPWISLTSNLQYDDVSEVMGLFARFRWIVRPGNEFFFVYTHNWQNLGGKAPDLDLYTLSRGATTKLNYTHRF